MYVQGSTENQFTEWIPCRNITITITITITIKYIPLMYAFTIHYNRGQ